VPRSSSSGTLVTISRIVFYRSYAGVKRIAAYSESIRLARRHLPSEVAHLWVLVAA
jgi:hypothetical protein